MDEPTEQKPDFPTSPDGLLRDLTLLSVVAPVLDEQEAIGEFCQRIIEALGNTPFELILVNDGSTDATAEILDQRADVDDRIRVLHLSRNFGHQAALTAGLDAARGDAVVMIDSDLQDPPELIPEMVEHWRQGSGVVYGVRSSRAGETRFKLRAAALFYRLFDRLSPVDLEAQAGDFRLLDRAALDAVLAMRESHRFLRGMTVWVGFTQTAVPYERDARFGGNTKFNLRRMISFSFDAIASFSKAPLRLATVLGFIFSIVAFLAIPIAIGFKIAGQFVPGITTVLLVVLLLGGIQLITVGVIGEYLGRVYDEVKQRPLYVIDRERGSDRDGA